MKSDLSINLKLPNSIARAQDAKLPPGRGVRFVLAPGGESSPVTNHFGEANSKHCRAPRNGGIGLAQKPSSSKEREAKQTPDRIGPFWFHGQIVFAPGTIFNSQPDEVAL